MSNEFRGNNKVLTPRKFRILSALSENPLNINEISAELSIPSSTIYRLIRDLVKSSCVKRDKALYSLTLKGRKIITTIEE